MESFITEKIKQLKDNIISTRRDFHRYPEFGWTEFRTSAIAISKMKKLGYKITMGKDAVSKSDMMGVPSEFELKAHQERAISQGADKELVDSMGGITGFWADMIFSEHGPSVALRFDLDSNDGNECQDADEHRPAKEGFASVNKGAMHACGHDGHVSIGLAVAEIIAGLKTKLNGRIRFIFQPAEEGLRGAAPMIAAGACDGVDYILGMHIGFQAGKSGDLICGAKGFLASTKWDVNFFGKSAHAGASPEEGENALLAAAVATINLHAISRHGNGTTRINVGKIIAGEGRNVIAPNALLQMETRGLTTELDAYMVEQSRKVIKASAEMYGCTYSIEVVGGTKSGESSQEIIDIVYETAKNMPFYKNIEKLKDFGAGEDFAHMMSYVQLNGGLGTYLQSGIDKTAGHHNNKFDFKEDDLLPPVELLCKSVVHLLKK